MFSVIIPLYNKAPYILRALDSVFAQTYSDFEVIVVDDGSTDGGEELVREKIGDKVQLITQENAGVSSARNKGIALASHPYIAFLDADDYWHPSYLEYVKKVIDQNPDAILIGAHYTFEDFKPISELSFRPVWNYFQEAIVNTLFFTSATVLKRSFFETNPGFDPSIKLGEDLDLWFQVMLQSPQAFYIENSLVHYAQEDGTSAIQKNYLLEESLIPKILQDPSYQFGDSVPDGIYKDFRVFGTKWVLFNLFPFYRKPQNKDALRKIIPLLGRDYFLLSCFYRLPFFILKSVFSSKKLSWLFRSYMKFCFRYIYRK
ncbi:glycosyltransferase family 2 protein [Algoriphagus sp. CAU 1675]|uniref:glycosyltransferase family 2 protein n=1 Tax=Algoriphagus sp. CAU 1675 TaxID=3032597 RepID=UPI0023DB8958|nr:glycosyltransferase family 2 protein [Algoriphagus sp. CAU 1675]MDF2159399.1 glycosyltransferase family 2 protein [Algoriphagus sp. CAU 1675]